MANWKTFYSNSLSNYQISENGEVINDRTKTIQKLSSNTGGYKTIKIQKKWFLIHRVVAQAFIPNPNDLPNVLHKDNNPSNNSVDNLYWGTQSDNIKQSVKDGTHPGFKNLKGQNQYTKAKQLGLPKSETKNQYTK
jgi:hypothetical protein